MHAASRESLETLQTELDKHIEQSDNSVAAAATAGAEIFDVVEVLDGDRGLRGAVADQSASAEQRSGIVRDLLNGKMSDLTVEVVATAAAQSWSKPRDLPRALVEVGRRALLRSAQQQNQLETVEDELFRLGHILANETQLEQLLATKTATPEARRELLASVLYGKVTSVTEALAAQAVARPRQRPADDITAISKQAANLRDCRVAQVTSATSLSSEQENALAEKLGRIYGTNISVHTTIDKSILGGLVIRVGDEVIDGSVSKKLETLRVGLG